MKLTIDWQGDVRFVAQTPTSHTVTLDGYPLDGQPSAGPTPMEMLLASVGACTAMDVVSILKKKRQNVTGYRIEVTGERGPEGVFPRPFVKVTVNHIVVGEGLDPVAVERAIELSDTKYCSVAATLRDSPEIVSTWSVEGA